MWIGPATGGNYSTAADWSLDVVPNNGNLVNGVATTFTAEIGNSAAVTLDTSATIDNLTIDATSTLSIANGQVLTMDGSGGSTISNAGTIQLNGGGGSNAFLILDTNTTLKGGGTMTMSVAGGGGSTYIDRVTSGVTLTNNSTIQGAGVIGNNGLTLINQATINANSSGQTLLLQSIMEACPTPACWKPPTAAFCR